MADFDLSLISNKKRAVQLHGKDVTFKILSVEKHLTLEFDGQEIDDHKIHSRKDIKKISDKIDKYVHGVLDLPVDETLTLDEYRRLRKYMSRIDMYDQGFTDKDIDDLERKAAFRVMSEAVTGT